MFPSHDMNPIAIRRMLRDRLDADIRHLEGSRGGACAVPLRPIPAVGIVLSILVVAAMLV